MAHAHCWRSRSRAQGIWDEYLRPLGLHLDATPGCCGRCVCLFCVCTRVCVLWCACECVCACDFSWVFEREYLCVHVCVCVCIHVCMCVDVCLCLFDSARKRARMHLCACEGTYICICECACAYMSICGIMCLISVFVCSRARTCVCFFCLNAVVYICKF